MPDEIKNGKQGAPQTTGQPSGAGKESTSQSPKTYTEEEIKVLTEKIRSDVLAEAGRKYKPIEDENATLKSQLATNQTLIKDTEGKIVKLQEEIEELAEDDPDKQKLVKKLRLLEEQERKLRERETQITDKETANAERIKKAEKYERDETIKSVVAEFTGITLEKLTTLSDKLNLTTKEQITVAAESIGTKVPAQPVHIDSGVTNGGGTDTSKMSPGEKIRWGLQHTPK